MTDEGGQSEDKHLSVQQMCITERGGLSVTAAASAVGFQPRSLFPGILLTRAKEHDKQRRNVCVGVVCVCVSLSISFCVRYVGL